MNRILGLALTVIVFLSFGPTAAIADWDKTFGGTRGDYGRCVRQTSDGGYIIVGETNSHIETGPYDVWLIKTDSDGTKLWDRVFGDDGYDTANSVEQTGDGGYIIAGEYHTGRPRYDEFVWLIKADSNGEMQWDRKFESQGDSGGSSASQTSDGGYIIVGDGILRNYHESDVWLIKTDSTGTLQWDQIFGGPDGESGYSVKQTSDGGYIIVGGTNSYGAGSSDVWLIKTDSNGTLQWDQVFGGTDRDRGRSVQQTSDGGYIIGGVTESYGAGGSDVWLIKTGADGSEQWNKTFGGINWDGAHSVQQTSDGGYVVAGYFNMYGGVGDAWLIKTDSDGAKQWDKVFSGTARDTGNSVQQTSDGGYIIAGTTKENSIEGPDVWLIKAFKPELTRIDLQSPASQAIQSSPPAFTWSANSGDNNVFAVDLALSLSGPVFSTPLIYETSWTMPTNTWNRIPSGRHIYWRVRGADLDATPLTIITSAEIWWFYKP